MVKKERRAKEVVTREYTINLHKKLHSIKFKSRAPRAVKEIKKFASKIMGTKDVRLDVNLNKAVWSKGIRNVPTRLRVVISRRRNEDEDAKSLAAASSLLAEEMYSFVTVAGDQTTKGKGPVVVQDS
ncbi:60S ribosomal protein L31 [Raphidocelis subcapitata]|uniref:60S ribosomal protein L31 n=1 Tax=Raphidocelis subcapitata TaxID=307507 RepID=A0A2V0NR10_9CHLO|nr:60S ribosomal protein L31 [Raphidocelis subcapitata]|eukprot:GBF90074.1 60S ribosomal protein L31 [Raphidocelis subcapitata]